MNTIILARGSRNEIKTIQEVVQMLTILRSGHYLKTPCLVLSSPISDAMKYANIILRNVLQNTVISDTCLTWLGSMDKERMGEMYDFIQEKARNASTVFVVSHNTTDFFPWYLYERMGKNTAELKKYEGLGMGGFITISPTVEHSFTYFKGTLEFAV